MFYIACLCSIQNTLSVTLWGGTEPDGKKLAHHAALLEVKGARELSTVAYRSALKAFLSSDWPPTVEGAAAYIEDLHGRRAASTINKTLSALRKAFSQAGESLGLPAREMAVIKGALGAIPGVKKAPPEVAVITEEERTRLLAALPLGIRLIAETLYVTGARVSEVLTVRRDQVKENGANGAAGTVELRLYGKGGRNVRGGSPRCSTGESWQSSPNAPTCSSRERGSTTSASMCRGRLLELHAAFWGDMSRRTCYGTRGRRTCWRRRTESRRSRGSWGTATRRPRQGIMCTTRSATRSSLGGGRKTRQEAPEAESFPKASLATIRKWKGMQDNEEQIRAWSGIGGGLLPRCGKPHPRETLSSNPAFHRPHRCRLRSPWI